MLVKGKSNTSPKVDPSKNRCSSTQGNPSDQSDQLTTKNRKEFRRSQRCLVSEVLCLRLQGSELEISGRQTLGLTVAFQSAWGYARRPRFGKCEMQFSQHILFAGAARPNSATLVFLPSRPPIFLQRPSSRKSPNKARSRNHTTAETLKPQSENLYSW